MTLAELIKRLAATTQIRLYPNPYTEIKGSIIDKDYMSYLRPYMEKEVDVITAHRDDDIKIILIWDDEEVET